MHLEDYGDLQLKSDTVQETDIMSYQALHSHAIHDMHENHGPCT
jgi:hypothetical protein